MDVDWDSEPDLEGYEQAAELRATDAARAVSKFEELASRGSAASMYCLGAMHQRGEGVTPDIEKAIHWFKRGSDAGSLLSSYWLGILYKRSGRYEEALRALQLAVSKGYGPSFNSLALMYFNGEGVERNIEKARGLWEEGIWRGQIYSKKNLGQRFLSGVYGLRHIPRGLVLFISAHSDFVFIYHRDDSDVRLH